MKKVILTLVCIIVFQQALSQESESSTIKPLDAPAFKQNPPKGKQEVSSNHEFIFSNKMRSSSKKSSSLFWSPLLSYALPGAGQFTHGQVGAGIVYSSVALIGLGAATSATIELKDTLNASDRLNDLDSRDSIARRYLWGVKTYDLAGSLSLYHSFQSRLEARKKAGDFKFLPLEAETTDELMLAPFEFSNLSRWSTIVPLALGLGLMVASGATDDYQTRSLNSGDLLFSSAISYNAGVGEEALFRGWMFPLLTEAYGVENIFWANLTQATIFGAAHFSEDNQAPVFQLLAGYYFGWLAQKNAWSLREAIFVHTWWDVIVFTASFTQGDKKASIYVPIYQTQF